VGAGGGNCTRCTGTNQVSRCWDAVQHPTECTETNSICGNEESGPKTNVHLAMCLTQVQCDWSSPTPGGTCTQKDCS
jgi:hypothetical protein